MGSKSPTPPSDLLEGLTRRHLVIGWAGLFVFASLGLALEVFHGLKLGLYLDTRNATRRLMWTLAHTHGTLFSLVHILFALTLARAGLMARGCLKTASPALTGALVLMPAGFFLGGLKTYGGDPGPGIILAPAGGLLLLLAVGAFLAGLIRSGRNRRNG